MDINAVRIRPTGQEDAWFDVGYAFVTAIKALGGEERPKNAPAIGEMIVVADHDGLTVIYERKQRRYELKLKLNDDTPSYTVEDVTPIHKLKR